MTDMSRVGDFSLGWGESLAWDDRRHRLCFVDCAARTLHWLENAEPPLETMAMPGLPVGTVLGEDGRLIVALDDGLHVVDVDARTVELLTEYPEGLGGRANDAAADAEGGVWGCVLGPGKIVRYTSHGVGEVIEAGVELPSDVVFGGEGLDRLYFVSIATMGGFESSSPNVEL